ncbi:MAG TPA: hypothetical protein VFL59_14405 [Candidatus Nanopelagicales bacterium]|nr:hypothetical protein [Candidatus Nanopelagicales bacterium]
MDDLAMLKMRWIEILDDLEREHRTAWLALFDGRLASLADGVLVLDFSDASKMAGTHGYERATKPHFAVELAESVRRVTGLDLTVRIVADVEP